MTEDSLFRLLLGIWLGLLLPVGLWFRIRSQSTGEKLDRMQEGLVILIGLRLGGALMLLVLILYFVAPDWIEWAMLPLPAWLRWLGSVLMVVATALQVWMFLALGKNITDTVVTRKEHTLVTHGPYRWIRHPLYVAFVGLFVAVALITTNWLFFAGGVFTFTLMVIRIRKEEANLLARFGEDYRRYRASTGAFLPRFMRSKEGGCS